MDAVIAPVPSAGKLRNRHQLDRRDPELLEIGELLDRGIGSSEIDSLIGPILKAKADEAGVVVTHTDGDEPGVAMTLLRYLRTLGLRPVAAIYSTFTQRAYDQVFHDICLQKLPVTLALDRAGLVGDDGPTHHGVFDFSYLRHLPEMTVMAPKDENELQHMLKTAIYADRPMALRYPRGNGYGVAMDSELQCLPIGVGEQLAEGDDLTLLAVGSTVYPAMQAAELLKEKGIRANVINARFIKPLDRKLIIDAANRTGCLITIEENALQGGFGSAVLELLADEAPTGIRVKRIGIPDRYIEQGSQAQLRQDLGLDAAGIARTAEDFLKKSNTGRTGLVRVK